MHAVSNNQIADILHFNDKEHQDLFFMILGPIWESATSSCMDYKYLQPLTIFAKRSIVDL